MRQLGLSAVVAALGLVLANACSGFGDSSGCCLVAAGGSSSGGSATGGAGGVGGGGVGGTGCQRQEYAAPGCGADVRPTCTNGTGGECFQRACGCDGHVLVGCGLYSVPFAYTFPGNISYDGGDTCDPTTSASSH